MKKIILAALLLWALLPGCGTRAPAREAAARLAPSTQTENDNLRMFQLDAADCRFLTVGKDLLVLRPTENAAELLRCTGKGLVIESRTPVGRDGVLLAAGGRIGCFDPERRTLTLFSAALEPEGEYPLPDCCGTPLLNEAGNRVCYGTANALMELNLETGIHRILRQQENLTPTGLVEEEGLVICGGEGESRYIRLEDGSLFTSSARVTDTAKGGGWLCLRCGFWDCLYLGQTMLPLPADWAFLTFLPEKNAALVLQNGKTLAFYDLTTGNRLAQLQAPGPPEDCCAGADGRVYFTAGGVLYQWEPEWQSTRDTRVKITALYTREAPDEKGLAQCRKQGAALENRYGVRVLLNTEGVQTCPVGVALEPEDCAAAVGDTLTEIETALSRFPRELVRAGFSGGGRFYICPVRAIQGEAEYGFRFWNGRDCYLVVAASDRVQETVVRLLSGLLERQLRMKSDVLDRWDSLNPPDFVYGAGQWDEDAFVTPAATESPAADRAELLWAALDQDSRERFLSARLQNKLRCLCAGLRQLMPQAPAGRLPWEQHLWDLN